MQNRRQIGGPERGRARPLPRQPSLAIGPRSVAPLTSIPGASPPGEADDDAPWTPDEPDPRADDLFSYTLDHTREHATELRMAGLQAPTGHAYHFAVLHCLHVRLVDHDGRHQRDPIDYEIRDAGGATLARGTARDGLIVHDTVAMGSYEIVIDGRSYPVASSPDVSDFESLRLAARSDDAPER